MRPAIIRKPAEQPVTPNWDDSAEARAAFSWQEQAGELSGLPGGGLNLGFEAVDRHAQGPRRQHVACAFSIATAAAARSATPA
jgi:acetyl-CoA synthetase